MIRKLTILRTRVRAEVQIGENEFGSAVVVEVDLPRNAQEVQDATVSLENLLLRTAQEHVYASANRQEFQKAVRAATAVAIDKERARIERNAVVETERKARHLEMDLDAVRRQVERLAADNERLRADLRAATEKESTT